LNEITRSPVDPFLLKIKRKNTPLLLIVKRRRLEPTTPRQSNFAVLKEDES